MQDFVHVDELDEGERVVSTEPDSADVEEVGERIMEEGLHMPLYVYPDKGYYRVVDDPLRLHALKSLHISCRWPAGPEHGIVAVVKLSSAELATFHVSDHVIDKQLDTVRETMYLQRVLEVYANAGPNAFGGRVRIDGRRKPVEQQPQETGFLMARYGWSHETARQAVHRTRVPREVLEELLETPDVTKRALNKAGQAIYHNPDAVPSDIARATLNGEPMPGDPQAPGGDDTDADGSVSAEDGGDTAAESDDAIAVSNEPGAHTPADSANDTEARLESGEARVEKFARQLAGSMNAWSRPTCLAFCEILFGLLAESAGPDPTAPWSSLQQTCRTLSEGTPDKQTADETSAQASTRPADDRAREPRFSSTICEETTASATASEVDGGPAGRAKTASASARSTLPAKPDAGSDRPVHIGMASPPNNAERPNPSRGQSNNGKRGGRCSLAEAQEGREIVSELHRHFGSLSRISGETGVGVGCLNRLLRGERVSGNNILAIQHARETYGV